MLSNLKIFSSFLSLLFSLSVSAQSTLDSLNNVIDNGEGEEETYFLRSGILMEAGLYDDALQDVEYCLSRNERHYKYLFQKALVLEGLERYTEALDFYTRSLKVNSASCRAYVNRGSLYLAVYNDHKKALKDFNRCLKSDPQNISALTNRATVFLELGEPVKALEDIKLVLELDDKELEGNILLGYALEDLSNYDSAIVIYDQVIADYPEDESAYLAKARLLGDVKQQFDEAVSVLDVYLEKDDANVDLRLERARYNAARERYRAALRDIDYCIDIYPEDIELYVIKGDYEFVAGIYRNAVASYSKAIELAGVTSGELYLYRGLANQQLGDREAACEDFSKSPELKTDRELSQWIEENCEH